MIDVGIIIYLVIGTIVATVIDEDFDADSFLIIFGWGIAFVGLVVIAPFYLIRNITLYVLESFR